MELRWTYPTMKYGFNPPAVYRMDFDNGYYYIGSSMRVKTRWNTWRTNFKRNIFQSKIMGVSLIGATSVVVSILEFPSDIKNEAELKERETAHLISCFSDPLFLNMTPNGFDHTGRKHTPVHLRKIREKKPKKPKVLKGKFKPSADYVWAFSKGVIQFDLEGNYIRSYKSISDAAKTLGVNERTISKHLTAKRVTGISGFVFKTVGDNSQIKVYKRIAKEKTIALGKGKPVIDLNTGIFYYSAKEAAAATKWKQKYFYRMLSGESPNTTQYRYA